MASSGSEVRYAASTMFGPFYRRDRPEGEKILGRVLRTGELGGRPPFGSDVPSVNAYAGELPDGEPGFEFYTPAEPDRPYGKVMHWRLRGDNLVSGDESEVMIKVFVGRVDQEIEWPQ